MGATRNRMILRTICGRTPGRITRPLSVRVGLAWLHDPAPLLVSDRFAHQISDLGIQLLTARTRPPAPGTTAAVMGTVLETAFDELSVGRPPGASPTRRLASKPGIRNRAVHRLNARADF